MELTKRNISLTCKKGSAMTQLTLDDDFNVPDTKADIERIMKYQGQIEPESIRALDGKVVVRGKLAFRILYGGVGGENAIHNMKGSIPFEETVNIEGILPEDEIQFHGEMEDLSISLINSRKISVKAVVTLHIDAEVTKEEEAGIELMGENDLQYTTQTISFTPLAIKTKDTFRVKNEIEVSGNKPNISEIIWDSAQLRSVETRPSEGAIRIRGEIFLFILYIGEDERNSIQWSEHNIPFDGIIDCNGCREDMIPAISCHLSGNEPEIKPDYDGEQRMLGIDYVIDMNIRLYEDQQMDIVNDVYSALKDLEPVTKKISFEKLVMRNSSKCKAADKLHLSQTQPKILQICNSSGTVSIDEIHIVKEGLQIDGVVNVSFLYVALDDRHPLQTMEGILPFSYTVEVNDIQPNCIYQVEHALEQLGTVMLNSEEIEMKAVISLDTLVMDKCEEVIITDVKEHPYDMKKIQELPGIVGYIVKPGDTLWKIAKKFYSTVESIKSINELSDDRIKPGDRLVLMKKVEEI